MAWKVEFTPLAAKSLDKLDRQIARRTLSFLHGRLALLDAPRNLGEALKGSSSAISGNTVLANIESSRA